MNGEFPHRVVYVLFNTVAQLPFNTVFVQALRGIGSEVVVVEVSGSGILKYAHAVLALFRIRGGEAYFVGYLSHRLVPIVFLLSRVRRIPLYFNAGHSIWEATVLDRGSVRGLRALWCRLLDALAFRLPDIVFLETSAQCDFVARSFWVRRAKCFPLYYGTDERRFYRRAGGARGSGPLRVLYRGAMLPFTGAEYAFRAMRILKNDPNVRFTIRSGGPLHSDLRAFVREHDLRNVTFEDRRVSDEELCDMVARHDVLLGVFSSHLRGSRTIPNRIYEALCMGVPLITGDTPSAREILTHRRDALLVALDDSQAIAEAIILLKDDALRKRVGEGGRSLFEARCSMRALSSSIRAAIVKRTSL